MKIGKRLCKNSDFCPKTTDRTNVCRAVAAPTAFGADRGAPRMWLHPELAEVGDLSYNEAMHKHLRRLDRVWPDSPIYFITMCTKIVVLCWREMKPVRF